VFSVTSDVAASAPYSSAPAKPAGRDPSQASDSFAALVDSNTAPDPSSTPAPTPDLPPSQRPARDTALDRSSRDTTAAADPTPPGRDDPPAKSGPSGSTDTADSGAKTGASKQGGSKSATSKAGDGKSTDKSSDKTAADDASATDTGTAASHHANDQCPADRNQHAENSQMVAHGGHHRRTPSAKIK